MKKFIAGIKRRFKNTPGKTIEQAFIAAYGMRHHLNLNNSYVIRNFLAGTEYQEVAEYIVSNVDLKSLDELVEAFEYLVSGEEKKSNGVVYTPAVIRDYILNEIIVKKMPPVIIDPACGCGAFLISAAQFLHKKYDITYHDIYSRYIWGCDIDLHSVDRCKLLLEMLWLQSGEAMTQCQYNLMIGNSLDKLAQKEYLGRFDIVVGNPPYVRAKNIDDGVRDSLKKWSVVSGNVDLYIPFFQLGMELLGDAGRLGYISPNTYLQSVNGRGLRNYIRDNRCGVKIINFKESQKFADVTHYTCITFVSKDAEKSTVEYAICEDDFAECKYTRYDISDYPDNCEWRFGTGEIDQMVYKIEHQPDKLGNYNIRNGLATLCNELFFFKNAEETDEYYIREYDAKTYKIEKNICIDIAKPNIMRTEADLATKVEKAVYPYKDGKIITEDVMCSEYPQTYNFLCEYKEKLLGRDKGKIENYPAWYAYGRTQGMNNYGSKILIPYMADRGVAIISKEYNMLFYCGYALFSDDDDVLRMLKNYIESDVFWFYIKMTSKPYSKGYMAMAKNYIKNFGIPRLSKSEAARLNELKGDERERFIAESYGLDHELIKQYIR